MLDTIITQFDHVYAGYASACGNADHGSIIPKGPRSGIRSIIMVRARGSTDCVTDIQDQLNLRAWTSLACMVVRISARGPMGPRFSAVYGLMVDIFARYAQEPNGSTAASARVN